MDALRILIGAALLYLGAEWLVAGASRLALSLRVPSLVVGLTVVAYGTSAPEIIVGVQAAHSGHGDLALGNVLGSNVANLGLILGLSTLVTPAKVDGVLRRRELPVLLVTTIVIPLLFLRGAVGRIEAVILIAAAGIYTAWMIRTSRTSEALREARAEASAAAGATIPRPISSAKQAALACVGIGVLLVGGNVFVAAASALARGWGMSERVLGLTIVALGTSLPELTTSVIAARRGSSEIAVGNVIGSNIFNVLVCLSFAALMGEVKTTRAFVPDVVALVALTLVAIVFLRTERTMRRWEGAVLVGGYLAYLAASLAR